jgi:hypothetical protein
MAAKSAKASSMLSVEKARDQFEQIINRAGGEDAERFFVGKRGGPRVVIIGEREYLANFASDREFIAMSRVEAVKRGANKITPREIDQEIAAYRRERAATNGSSKRRA